QPPDLGGDSELAQLDPFIDCRLRWPEEAPLLAELIEFDGLARAQRGGAGEAADPGATARFPVLPELARELEHSTPSLLPLAQALSLAALHDVTVLLTGETGTGKTHLAQLIHQHSPRKDRRFLVVPCGALSPSLLESEFFGHAKGAFTGADRAKVG